MIAGDTTLGCSSMELTCSDQLANLSRPTSLRSELAAALDGEGGAPPLPVLHTTLSKEYDIDQPFTHFHVSALHQFY